jgi:hypothetical protein
MAGMAAPNPSLEPTRYESGRLPFQVRAAIVLPRPSGPASAIGSARTLVGQGGNHMFASSRIQRTHEKSEEIAMTRFRVLFVICAFVSLVSILGEGSQIRAADENTLLGTWKLNVQKSRFVTGEPYRSSTRTYEPFEGDGIRFRVEIVEADGTRRTVTWSARFDGKDYPNTDTANRFDAVSVKRIDAYTTENTLKKGGKVVQTTKIVVSKDGKIMTVTQERTDAANVLVFEKQ